MTTRRDLLLGGLMAAAASTAYAITPRRKLSLLASRNLETLIPRSFPGWSEVPNGTLVVPQNKDSLAARLYSQSIGRIYANPDNQIVMLLIAYGDTQSDELQLHRPEVCYPAFGFDLRDAAAVEIGLRPGLAIPGRRLVAVSDFRREQILYWTRVGEYLPASGGEQRWMRLKTEMSGYIPDGVLVRFSNVLGDAAAGLALNRAFVASFVEAISPAARRALMGTRIAQDLSG